MVQKLPQKAFDTNFFANLIGFRSNYTHSVFFYGLIDSFLDVN